MAGQSLLERMNLPDGFGYVLLMLGLILTLAPWLRGSDFGMFKIPDFGPGTRRGLVYLGPLTLLLAIGMHLPVRPSAGEPPKPDPPAEDIKERRVLADWQDSGCLYPARVIGEANGRATLLFDFDKRATLPLSEVYRPGEAEIGIGRSAFAKLPARDIWLPVTILNTRTRNVQVERNNEAACTTEFGKAVRWVPTETLIAAIPIGEAE